VPSVEPVVVRLTVTSDFPAVEKKYVVIKAMIKLLDQTREDRRAASDCVTPPARTFDLFELKVRGVNRAVS
jgi:hypothetical protein